MTRVLVCHNFYRSAAPSGEDVAYKLERALLEENGIGVVAYEKHNDAVVDLSTVARIQLGLDSAWSKTTYNEISHIIREAKPTVAHFHNTFPQISPSAYAACRDFGVPVVQTLHNYRLICPGALLMRDNHPCEQCVGASLLPALRHRCYRGSLTATSAVVWMLMRNRWAANYSKLVNRYVALTEFQAGRLIAGGLPAEKISIKPNFLPEAPALTLQKREHATFVGHLSAHKGVRTLLEAWRTLPDLPLKIIGTGPLEEELRAYASSYALNVSFLGFLPRQDVLDVVRRALVQIVPSLWYEGLPMTVVEAYACGTPVVASRIGSLTELVHEGRTGYLFTPGSAPDLAEKVRRLVSPGMSQRWQTEARALFDSSYRPERNLGLLKDIYTLALSGSCSPKL
jgi:glycosyltransferase involved in cell wall biosynthesis